MNAEELNRKPNVQFTFCFSNVPCPLTIEGPFPKTFTAVVVHLEPWEIRNVALIVKVSTGNRWYFTELQQLSKKDLRWPEWEEPMRLNPHELDYGGG